MNTAVLPFENSTRTRSSRQSAILKPALELRFQVYCEECKFLPAEQYPQRLESDEFDDRSKHFYGRDMAGDLVGYVRLVPPDTLGHLPFMRHCKPASEKMADLPFGDDVAEISRLMLRHEYRRIRTANDGSTPTEDPASEAVASLAKSGARRAESTEILLNLYRQMYLWSKRHGVRYWYAAMERPLARSLAAAGFPFRQIGPTTEYYGAVAPYMADLRELEELLKLRQPDLLAWMRETPNPAAAAAHRADRPVN